MAKGKAPRAGSAWLLWIGIATLILVLDQLSKVLILGGWQRWFFTGLGTVAALVMVWMLRAHAGQRLFCWAISFILGGAVGNVIDRLLHGYVVDFLDFYWGHWHFPAFNLADSAITLGAILLILDELLRVRRGR